MQGSEPTEEDIAAVRALLGSSSVGPPHEPVEGDMQSYISRIAADYDRHQVIAQDRADRVQALLKEVKDIVLNGTVGGIKRTENTHWPAELERIFGLKGFTAYDTEHGFTTLILPTGYGVIVRVTSAEGTYNKGEPIDVGHHLLAHACRKIGPVQLEDGLVSDGSHVCIENMRTPEQRLMLEDFKTVDGKDVVYTVGYIDRSWIAQQVNERPELLYYFRF